MARKVSEAQEGNYHHGDLKNALITAGIEILSKDGISGLSLRKVAKAAGVSHAAPYAHFEDKQALVASIAAEGYKKLYDQLSRARRGSIGPLAQLLAVGEAYITFALNEPDHFKITFSGIVEAEQNYPDYVEQSKRCFALVMDAVEACQAAGSIERGDTELIAINIWAGIHGLVQLLLGNQLPSAMLVRYSATDMLRVYLRQFLRGERGTPA